MGARWQGLNTDGVGGKGEFGRLGSVVVSGCMLSLDGVVSQRVPRGFNRVATLPACA